MSLTKQQHHQAYDVASSFIDSVLSKWATRITYEKHLMNQMVRWKKIIPTIFNGKKFIRIV